MMKFIEKYENFCIDIDGVLWNEDILINQSLGALNFLCSHNKNIFLITNNTNSTKEELLSKLYSFGYTNIITNVYTVGYATCHYLRVNFPNLRKIAVIGLPGLRKFLKSSGYDIIYPSELNITLNNLQDFNNFEVDPDIDAVIAAFDMNFDYFSALYCCACIQNGADFIGLHLDRFAIYGDIKVPATGCIVKFIETATGKKAKIIGKPTDFMFNVIEEEYKIDRHKTVIIGDSMDSDIKMGINCNIDTILVLSGVTKLQDLLKYDYGPNFILNTLAEIVQ